jgi:cation transport ATPase
MIKAPAQATASGSAGLALPSVIVILVILLGATIFLWRARYMRRKTAYMTMAILVIALIGLGASMYAQPN